MEILTCARMLIGRALQNLDPSLFQNVIMGLLAIFIPFAIVFLTDVLNSEKQRSEFEKMVLNEEVLGTKGVFWWSIIGIGILAFFAGEEMSNLRKILAFVFTIVVLWRLSRPLWKILKFSDGQQYEFEISFLKKLNFSKFFPCRHASKAEKMIRAWSSFWEGGALSGSKRNEIIEIFYGHIDGAMENKKYDTAVSLAKVYESNFLRMTIFVMSEKVLPKSLEWYEKSWEIRLEWEKQRESHRSSPKKFLSKFRLSSREEHDSVWGWRYFQYGFLKSVILHLLLNEEGHAPLFTFFDKYIKQKGAEENFKFIERFFRTFCNIFFESRHGTREELTMWEEDFPKHWKITMANSKTQIPRVILRNFWRWAYPRIASKNSTPIDHALSGVTTGIFPSIDSHLFSCFLILCCSEDLSSAIQKKVNFYLSSSYNLSPSESKEETLNIILEYFGNSKLIAAREKELFPEGIQHGKQYSTEAKKIIFARARNKNLRKIRAELKSKKIRDLCKKSEDYEIQRNNFIELIELLIEKVSKESITTNQNANPSIS